MNKRREIWADNAKFIGITLMLIGHNSLASNEVFDFIYAFHMPLFFILSGYFASDKREPFMPYLKKNIRSLLVPYFMFSLIVLPLTYFHLWSNRDMLGCNSWNDFLIMPILGIFFVKTTIISYFTGPIWFFVALFIVKMLFFLYKLFYTSKYSLISMSIVCTILFLLTKSLGIQLLFRLDSALLCFPFYVIGFTMKYLNRSVIFKKKSYWSAGMLSCVLFILTYYISINNGHVEISDAGYGHSLLLMYIGAILGSLGVIVVSRTIGRNEYISTIGGGTAVILGLHGNIQAMMKQIVVHWLGITTYSLWAALLMVTLLLLIHIPIIYFMNKSCPFLIGKQK